MKKLFFKLILFFLPLLVALVPPFMSLYSYRENFHDIDDLVDSEAPYLVGYAYNERNYKYFKWKVVAQSAPVKVWSVGSSRTLQFRSGMFNGSFYNAGYTITNIKDFVPFLKTIDATQYPEILIINLDQWMFNAKYDPLKATPNAVQWTQSFTKYPDYQTILNVWKDLIHKKYPLLDSKTEGMTRIGLNAIVNYRGFRNDGSMYYGNQVDKLLSKDTSANDHNYKDTFGRIKNGSSRFEHGDSFNEDTLPILINLLNFCQENQIHLIAFLPPYAPDVYNKMLSTGKYNYITQIEEKIKPYFNEFGFEFYDFTDPYNIETDNTEYLDGFHGGEIVYAKMLLKMIALGSHLNTVVDTNELGNTLGSNKNPLILYP